MLAIIQITAIIDAISAAIPVLLSDRARGANATQSGDGREGDQQALRILRADPGNQDDAEGDRADDSSHGVGRVNLAD